MAKSSVCTARACGHCLLRAAVDSRSELNEKCGWMNRSLLQLPSPVLRTTTKQCVGVRMSAKTKQKYRIYKKNLPCFTEEDRSTTPHRQREKVVRGGRSRNAPWLRHILYSKHRRHFRKRGPVQEGQAGQVDLLSMRERKEPLLPRISLY